MCAPVQRSAKHGEIQTGVLSTTLTIAPGTTTMIQSCITDLRNVQFLCMVIWYMIGCCILAPALCFASVCRISELVKVPASLLNMTNSVINENAFLLAIMEKLILISAGRAVLHSRSLQNPTTLQHSRRPALVSRTLLWWKVRSPMHNCYPIRLRTSCWAVSQRISYCLLDNTGYDRPGKNASM